MLPSFLALGIAQANLALRSLDEMSLSTEDKSAGLHTDGDFTLTAT